MLFTSFEFILLLFITFLLYYIPYNRKLQVHILLLASFIFYAYNNPVLLLLLIFSTSTNVIVSYMLGRAEFTNRLKIATVGVIINLSILAIFKYSPLIGRSFFSFSDFGEFLISIPLPIGISFFTFQGISLVVDAYKGKNISDYSSIVVKNFLKHSFRISFYISFFAQLVAGPIVKAHQFLPQIKPKKFSDINWNGVFEALVTGYFLKMVIADNLKDQTFMITYPYFLNESTLSLLSMIFGYSMQIFADFAGYSLIAIGIGRLFGYDLPQNFNFPYISSSFSEFWKRWHISLSSFLKEYLYIPLGGNKKGAIRTYANLMITMLLGGFWHGAAWSYMIWGGVHGLFLAIERFFNDIFSWRMPAVLVPLKVLFVFLTVTLAWLLFRLPNFHETIMYIESIFDNRQIVVNPTGIFYIAIYSLPILLYHLHYLLRKQYNNWFSMFLLKPVSYGTMLFLILTNSGTSGAFIYFQF